MTRRAVVLLAVLASGSASADMRHDRHDRHFGYARGERVEYQESGDGLLWDLQGRYGGDYQGLAWKTEGRLDGGDTEDAELQLLYDRAITPYFNLQLGARWLDTDAGGLAWAVAGIQGLLPYRIETDAALFISEDGDAALRAEFEKDFLLTEHLVLQPRAELDIAFSDIADLDTEAGVSDAAVGLRLRYEVTRKFAPYVGLEWEKTFNDRAGDASDTTLLAGLRFWF